MVKDVFDEILKKCLEGYSLRELSKQYNFDRNKFIERLKREYPEGSKERQSIEKQLVENKKNSTLKEVEKDQLEELTQDVIEGKILMRDAAAECGLFIQTFREKMEGYINSSNNVDLQKKYIEYRSKREGDYSWINFKALLIKMIKTNSSQTQLAETYGIPARTVSRELAKLKDDEKYEDLYEIAKKFSKKNFEHELISDDEVKEADKILKKYHEGSIIISNSISKEEKEYLKDKKLLKDAEKIPGTQKEKAAKLGVGVSTLRRAKIRTEQYEKKKKIKQDKGLERGED